MAETDIDKVKKLVRSVIISTKDGLTIQDFIRDYKSYAGQGLPPPFEKLGFRSLEDMLRKMPDVVEFYRGNHGQSMLRAVSDESTQHIANMISRQKSNKSKGTKNRPRPLHSSYNRYSSHTSYTNFPSTANRSSYQPNRNLPPRLQAKTSQNNIPVNRPVFTEERNGRVPSLPEHPFPSPHSWSKPPYPRFDSPPSTPKKEIRTNKEILAKWAEEKGIEIEYSTRQIGKSKDVRSHATSLTVGKDKFSSFPLQTSSATVAEEEAARKAVISLNILQDSSKFPEAACKTDEEIEELIEKIDEIVKENNSGPSGPSGIWNIKVEEQFKQRHEQVLPPHWLQLISSTPQFRIEKVNDQRYILYPKSIIQNHNHIPNLNNNAETPARASVEHPKAGGDSDPFTFYDCVEPITLPESNDWEVELVYVAKGDQITVRLVEYNESFSIHNQDMNEFYESGNARPAGNCLPAGCLCAVKVDDSWHRVVVLSQDDQSKIELYFVDFGDTTTIPASSCFILEPQFCKIPYQAIWCNLIGLEEFKENKKCMELLVEGYLGSTLIARLHNIYEESIANVTIYDTSSDDDIDVNELLKDKMIKAQLCPKLPEVGTFVPTTVRYISPSGVVGFVMSEEGVNALNNLMDNIDEKAQRSLGLVTQPKKGELYCAKFGEEEDFYRALVTNFDEKNPTEVEVYYVDYGNTEIIPISDLASTEDFPPLFAELPHQALRGVLIGLPPVGYKWSEKAVEAFYALLPEQGEKPFLKIFSLPTSDSPEAFPEIELLRRNKAKELISINNNLAFETELFTLIEENVSPARKALPPNLRILQVKNNVKVNKELPKETEVGSNEVASASKQNVNEQGTPLRPPPIPEVGHFFNVFIPMVAHPNNFICQSYETLPHLEKLMADITSFYNNEENLVEMDPCLIFKHKFYAGRFGKEWYRICIKHIISNEDKKSFVVSAYFVDYGHYRALYLNDMQPLYNTFRELPFQAISASLAGEKPLKQNWSIEDCLEFKSLVEKKALVSVVRHKVPDTSNFPELGGQIVTLTLIDTSKEGLNKYAYLV